MSHRYEQLSPHVFLMHAEHETDRPILAAITGERRTLLMDAGNSPAHAELFRQELDRRGIRQPDLMVLTHWHWDHTFGMEAWNGITALAQEETGRTLASLEKYDWSDTCLKELVRQEIISSASEADIRKEYGGNRSIRLVRPDVLFKERIEVDLGGVTCEAVHVGGDHSPDSCYLFVREDKVLFLGDALGPSVYGGPRLYTSGSFLRLLSAAFGFGAHLYVESHGIPMDDEAFRADLAPWRLLAETVKAHGGNREAVVRELKARLSAEELPVDLLEGIGYFMAGIEAGTEA